jgi:UPF0755 protein
MKKNTSKYKKIIILLLIAFTISAGTLYLKYNSYIKTPVDPSDNSSVSFQIKKGSTPKEVGKELEKKGLIKSDLAFYLYLKMNSLGENILAGRFLLNKAMTIPEIISTISDPTQAEFIITIQEGLTTKDIDKKLSELELINEGEFIKEAENFNGWEYYSFLEKDTLESLKVPIEGYLYPDTYFLDPENFHSQDLIYLAMDNFEKKTSELIPKKQKHSINEIITMASIIENEVFGIEDRKKVSGILWKRLENDWTIGADAAILYITEDREITAEDLNIESPYNLRKYKGLCPGPISNPSLESIEAAMYPTESEYWFYLTTKEGEVIYSKTNEEHNANRAKYL